MLRGSSTYDAIFREGYEEGLRQGRLIGCRRVLRRQGATKLGKPDAATVAVIKEIRDYERLRALCSRLVDDDVRTWADLLRGL